MRNFYQLLTASVFGLLCTPVLAGTPPATEVPKDAKISFIDNGSVCVGVDLNHGGAIVYLSRDGGQNLINNYDFGRQSQLAFYSGPVPYTAGEQTPAKHWAHLGWNPVQTGDDFKNASKVLRHENTGHSIYVQCTPLQWPLNHVQSECTFESWIELDGICVKGRAKINNARSDKTQYPARQQELPALYSNAAYPRVVSYIGNHPFTGEAITDLPKSKTRHPWTSWVNSECWSALLNENNKGVGLISPGRYHFTGGFAGKPGANDTFGNSTGYLASINQEILDHNISYGYVYELVPGTLDEIRERAARYKQDTLPSWNFSHDRQGWYYVNASDSGWPIEDALKVSLEKNDPQMHSPITFWNADHAPYVVIEAAFQTQQKNATLFWQNSDFDGSERGGNKSFQIQSDGLFHQYIITLKDTDGYQGTFNKLRLDPVASAENGAWMQIRSIRLSNTP